MRIAFFLGRIHHAHKLLGVASALKQNGAEIDIVVSDNSVNIDPSTEYLHMFGIDTFYHTKDYIDEDSIAAINNATGAGWINDEGVLKYFPPFWILSSYREAMECIVGFEGYLNAQKPDAVFALHENNFWVRILFYLAQKKGITTYSLQEGIILKREEEILKKYSTGTEYTDILFSWSERDKGFYSDTARIVPVGPSHMDQWVGLSRNKEARDNFKTAFRESIGMPGKKLVVFAPPRLDLFAGDFKKTTIALAKLTMNRGMGLIIKLHPFQNGVDTVKEMVEQYGHVKVADDSDSLQFIMTADVLVTQTSTVAIEAAILGVPVVELDMDYIGLDQTINQHGGATLIEGDNINGIMHAMDDDTGKEFVDWYFPLADGKSTERIVDYVMAGLWAK